MDSSKSKMAKLIRKIKEITKSDFFYSAGVFAGGNIVAAAISSISGIISARWILPEVLGEFRQYQVLTGYLGIGLIVVHGAFQRHYLFYHGKGAINEANIIASYSKWWYVSFSYFCSAIFIILTIINIVNNNYSGALGWLIQIPLIWVSIFGQFLQVIYRNSHDFKKLTMIRVFSNSLSFLLLPLIWFFNLWGLFIRFGLEQTVSLFVLNQMSPVKIKSKFSLIKLFELLKVSIPLSVPAYIDTYLLNSSIVFFILKSLGKNDLGIYTMALSLQSMLSIFSSSIHQIFTTKIAQHFGKTGNIILTFNYSVLPMSIILILTVIIIIIFNFIIGPFVSNITPKYIDSIPVLRILIWQIFFSMAMVPYLLLSNALYFKTTIILRIFKTIITVALLFILNSSLVNIAWAIVIADFIYTLSGFISIYLVKKKII